MMPHDMAMYRVVGSIAIAAMILSGCGGSYVGEVEMPLDRAIVVDLDKECDASGSTVSVRGARIQDDLLYIEYWRGHGCDVHTPQVCMDRTIEEPRVRFWVRDITEDICEAAAKELIAVRGIPSDLRLLSVGNSAVLAERSEEPGQP